MQPENDILSPNRLQLDPYHLADDDDDINHEIASGLLLANNILEEHKERDQMGAINRARGRGRGGRGARGSASRPQRGGPR